MRFDPKLVQPDDAPLDEQGEIDLPDDLAELASQLGDDAAYLASRYPAIAAEVVAVEPVIAREIVAVPDRNAPRVPSRRQGWLIASAAAALAVLIVTSVVPPNADTPVRGRESAHSAPTPVIADSDSPTVRSAQPVATPPVRERPPLRTVPSAMLLNGVSGPELEGLLDLWQNDDEADNRISI